MLVDLYLKLVLLLTVSTVKALTQQFAKIKYLLADIDCFIT